MSIENSTTPAPAATTDLFRAYSNPKALAVSLKASASYLEHCAEKHNVPIATTRLYEKAKRCEKIAGDMERLKDNNPAFIRYRNALGDLDAVQIEAFARIIIDYQARIGGEFVPVSTNHYLADLTAIIFALAAIEDPACLFGVGTGFAPRDRRRNVPMQHTGNVVSLRAGRETV